MKTLIWEEVKQPEKSFVKIIVRKSFLTPKLTQPNPLPPLSRFFHPLIIPGPPTGLDAIGKNVTGTFNKMIFTTFSIIFNGFWQIDFWWSVWLFN